ncbi:hypothetical protein C8D88_1244 [Lentzea atacamensis]|uniref:Uncharacterized protein n=1 Tax=Lentzea atacamensis TaxID=531938 RepID=A0A316HFY5_9PSEU|nr:hypothetical protein [Lentzea atacamensis]PWK79478.1 hypothetical protein C8D88_1244 [Lentzea atacamensis]
MITVEDVEPVADALRFLVERDYLTQYERDGDTVLTVTELGRLTAQLMVSTYTGARLRQVFGMLPLPDDADMAEEALTCVLSVTVPELLDAPVAEANRSAVATAIRARGRSSRLTDTTAVQGLGSSASVQRGDLAWATLLLVARSPHLFAGNGRDRRAVAGIPIGTLYPVLYEALNVEIVYNATGRTLDASIRPVGRDKASVRGGLGHSQVASLRSLCVHALLDSSNTV